MRGPDMHAERFRSLYEETRARLVAYALRRTASGEDAADVVAETYAIAWRRIEDVPDGRAGLLWLYVTARNVLRNRGRRQRHDDELRARLALGLEGVESASEPLDEDGLIALLCLRSLPEHEREILMLAAWDGLGASELGRVLRCSPTAARLRLHRARVHLREEIAAAAPAPTRRTAPRHGAGDGAIAYAPKEARP